MITYSLTPEIDIKAYETSAWAYPVHNHRFFEIIHVVNGTGMHEVNGRAFNYRKDSLFMLAPGDRHTFHVDSRSQFNILGFNRSYLIPRRQEEGSFETIDLIDRIIWWFSGGDERRHEFKIASEEDSNISTFISLIREELKRGDDAGMLAAKCALYLLLIHLARRMKIDMGKPGGPPHRTQQMLEYIEENIGKPELLRAEILAEKFYIAKGYVGQYFKIHNGKLLKDHIMDRRLAFASKLLKDSMCKISEIAQSSGFADDSHFRKSFEKKTGMNPSVYRKRSRLRPSPA